MQNKLFKAITEHAMDGIIVTDAQKINNPDGPLIIYVNDSYLQMTGYTRKEVIGNTPRILHGAETDRRELDKIKEGLKKGEPVNAELINYKKSGEKFWTSISIFPIKDNKGVCMNFIGIKRDITESKKREEALNKSLSEKNLLLQEVQHRVKNNLAVISSLVYMQAYEEENTEIKNKLYDVTTRIKSMAIVHEFLYKSQDINQLEFGEFIKILVDQIIEVMRPSTKYDINFSTSPVYVNITQAFPLAMITNEVITNVFKHGFRDHENGRIDVELTEKQNHLTLKIKNTGNGLPVDFENSTYKTLGLKIIRNLSDQLEADFKFKRLKGETEFSIGFDLVDIEQTPSPLNLPKNLEF